MEGTNKLLAVSPDAGGEQLGVAGNINAIMQQIIELMETTKKGKEKFGDWPVVLDDLVNRLLLFLNADEGIEDDAKAFALTEPCMAALMDALSRLYVHRVVKSTNVQLLTTIPTVTRCITERFWDQLNSPYGARAMVNSVFKTYNAVLHESQRGCRTKQFVTGAYKTLSACLYNPDLRPALLEPLDCGKFERLPGTSVTLMTKQYAGDQEAAECIVEFLSYLVRDKPGAEIFAKKVVCSPAGCYEMGTLCVCSSGKTPTSSCRNSRTLLTNKRIRVLLWVKCLTWLVRAMIRQLWSPGISRYAISVCAKGCYHIRGFCGGVGFGPTETHAEAGATHARRCCCGHENPGPVCPEITWRG